MVTKNRKKIPSDGPLKPPELVPLEGLLDVTQVTKILCLSRRKVYDLISNEGLPSIRIGDRRLFLPSSLMEWIKQREEREFAS